jgi:CRP/FNR family transcriptional regulator
VTEPDLQLLAAEVRSLYPGLASLGPGALEVVLARSQLVPVPAGTPMFGEGSPCRQLPLVLEGSIRVAKCSDAPLLVLPKPLFDELMATHEPFRRCVFSLFAERIADLMALVEAVAFHRLDRRVAGALLGRGRLVALTHQQLADELGSVREIVTRVLRSLAEQGLVRSSRAPSKCWTRTACGGWRRAWRAR